VNRKLIAGLVAVALAAALADTATAGVQSSDAAGRAVGATRAQDWKPVEQALGMPGKLMPGEVFRIGMPRSDLHVVLDGVELKAGFALGSYLVFKKYAGGTLMMGDLVLTERELEPVMLKLVQGGVGISAIHNHLIGERPHVLYLHVMQMGDPVKLARAVRTALALSATPLTPAPKKPQPPVALPTKQLDQIVGAPGKADGGIYKFTIARPQTLHEDGMLIPPAMGMATSINFQPTGAGKAAITGDFVLLAAEVNPTLGALRQGGIDVTALHSHALTDQPRLFFMHFWANADALRLAHGLHTALLAAGQK
jgi:hypothetical protein